MKSRSPHGTRAASRSAIVGMAGVGIVAAVLAFGALVRLQDRPKDHPTGANPPAAPAAADPTVGRIAPPLASPVDPAVPRAEPRRVSSAAGVTPRLPPAVEAALPDN